MTAVKLFDPFSRKAGISIAEFSHHWITHHAEIVTRIPRVRRYIQSLRLEVAVPSGADRFPAPRWDGCAETWHDDPSSIAAMVDEPLFGELMADERNFLDLSAGRDLIVTTETVLDEDGFDPRVRGVKMMVFARRHPSSSPSDFRRSWEADLAAAGRTLGVTRHVVCTAIGDVHRAADAASTDANAQPAAAQGFSGVRELWWPDIASLTASIGRHPDLIRRIVAPEGVDPARSTTLVVRERVIVP
ncbi:EthD domain-containing protein [Microbacterium aurantiacum]|uniref:EthD domain-containing protein n=1 Tax=Microbacterium aurantiacum TaxID=162393 RepID=UPI003D717331